MIDVLHFPESLTLKFDPFALNALYILKFPGQENINRLTGYGAKKVI